MSFDEIIKIILGVAISTLVPMMIKVGLDKMKTFGASTPSSGGVVDSASPPKTEVSVLSHGTCRILLFLEIAAVLLAAALAWIKVVLILAILPIVVFIGILLFIASKKKSYSTGEAVGLSSIALFIVCVFFLLFPWQAGQAKLPIQIILTLYSLFICYFSYKKSGRDMDNSKPF